jgi:hypothetical protein
VYFEQCNCGFPDTNRVLGDALVAAIVTLADILYGKIPTVH